MENNNFDMLCTVACNLLTAHDIISDAKYERTSKPLLKESIKKAVVLLECSLEALKDNEDKLFV